MADSLLINVVVSVDIQRSDDPGELIRKLTEAFEQAGISRLKSISWAPVRELSVSRET